TLVEPDFDFCDPELDENDDSSSSYSIFGPTERKLRKSFLRSNTISSCRHMDKNPVSKEERQDDKETLKYQRFNYELHMFICTLSISSYIMGYFGFAFIWVILVLYQSVVWYMNMIQDQTERVRWEVKREMASDQTRARRLNGELNYLLQQIWRTFDPSLLTGLRDTIEDTMSRSLPKFVSTAYIESFEIGLIAPRIENIKILPRRENDDDDDVVIGEATISFRARSSTGTPQDAPPHILAWIKTGISAIIPIKVEFIGFVASIHFEIKITGSSPFVSTGKFSFINFPTYETSIMPLIPMNVAQFPIIKQFIRNTVHMVLEGFTYPKFVTVDLAELLTGDDLLHDTQAIGIVKVDVIQAKDLAKMDVSGDNDPYVLMSLDPSPYMHPNVSTRVIENCANPIWSETFFHKIPELDIVDEHIKFKLKVMDWDRFTPDDPIGAAWIDIKDAIGDGKQKRKIFDGWVDLHLKPNDGEVRGKLRFRLTYYPKLPNGVEPSPDQLSGILGLKIHQAMSLQITAAPYNKRSDVVMPGNHSNAQYPNPYGIVYLNDRCVYRTRTKLNNVAPFWNASTEHFVRDWQTAIVRVIIKDHKDLEYDPVIGMVTIPLKDLFEKREKKKVTKWYPLRHGVGCGKVRLSFLYKPISIRLKPHERGFSRLDCNMFLTFTLSGAEFGETTVISNSNPPTWLDPSTGERIQFGVLKRHRTALIISLKQRGLLGIVYTIGTSTFWLRRLIDCNETEITIPLKSGRKRNTTQSSTLSSLCHSETTIRCPDNGSQEYRLSEPHEGNAPDDAQGKRNILGNGDAGQTTFNIFDDSKINHPIFSEPIEIDENEQASSSYATLQASNNENFKVKGQVEGYLRLKLYFRPALSISHEEDIKRSLTGVNASVLYQNPFVDVHGDEDGNLEVEERCIPSGETYDVEVDERRINRLHRRRTMRQLQWVKDLVGTKVTAISGKRDWEDEDIIEHEV
ncbi:12851_t:CDS:10, partial [Acaulospora morrowiae]